MSPDDKALWVALRQEIGKDRRKWISARVRGFVTSDNLAELEALWTMLKLQENATHGRMRVVWWYHRLLLLWKNDPRRAAGAFLHSELATEGGLSGPEFLRVATHLLSWARYADNEDIVRDVWGKLVERGLQVVPYEAAERAKRVKTALQLEITQRPHTKETAANLISLRHEAHLMNFKFLDTQIQARTNPNKTPEPSGNIGRVESISSEASALPKNGLRLPPAYTKTGKEGGDTRLRAQLAQAAEGDAPPPYTPTSMTTPSTSTATHSRHSSDTSDSAEGESTADTIHHLSPNDTLTSLSLAYKVPVSVLQQHNNLYSSNLLAGRKTLSVPASHYQGPPLSNPPDPAEERRKVRVRRFMVGSKCADYKVAEVYLRQVAVDLAGERAAEAVGTEEVHAHAAESVTETQREEEEDDRVVKEAVERYKADEEWERRNPLEKQKKGNAKKRGAGGSLVGQLF
ncbi:uncharacterized protein AB675_2224 [Cyphellophora attinorum]|uniref:LysM domain-containing protein n=1 Tax=Cyphellophora attinorum TaxID=1664694 RepID=A0A0N1HXN2_9EURO|nr:uncharacterized protein AB675_2224 [Phialophora attinorum]KPI42816.1 hypothetical protein AB675_2224 [Phialophora attinorum]